MSIISTLGGHTADGPGLPPGQCSWTSAARLRCVQARQAPLLAPPCGTPSTALVHRPPSLVCMCRQVISGYNVVRAVEMCGARSGETSQDVMIADW